MSPYLTILSKVTPLTSYSDLRSFLSLPESVENNVLEFKQTITQEHICKPACSFANCEGGVIIYGIQDGSKRIMGMAEINDALTRINRYLSQITPPIPPGNIKLLPPITFSRPKKFVYILAVKPSLSKDRPHMFERKIFVRGNGESDPLKYGHEIRTRFFSNKFEPGSIEQIEFEIQNLREFRTNPSQISTLYFRELQNYLSKMRAEILSLDDSTTLVDACISLSRDIDSKMFNIQRLYANPTQEELENNNTAQHEDELEELIRSYIDRLKELLQ